MQEFTRKRAKKLLFLLLILAVTLLYVVIDRSYSRGEIHDEGALRSFRSRAISVGALLEEEGITLKPGDRVSPGIDQPLSREEMQIVISRIKDYSLIDGLSQRSFSTTSTEVGEILSQAGITLSALDIVRPSLSSHLRGGETISIERISYRETKILEEIPYYSLARLASGEEEPGEILQEGEAGEQESVLREKLVNGEVVSSKLISTSLTKKPVNEIRAAARPLPPVVEEVTLASRGAEERSEPEPPAPQESAPPKEEEPEPQEPVAEEEEESPPQEPQAEEESPATSENDWGEGIVFEATAYNIQGTTYSGVPSGPGKVAVDPSVIPIGTRLYIESMDDWPDYGYAIAADTGSAVKGNIVDVFYYDYDTCIRFGRRNVKVYILD